MKGKKIIKIFLFVILYVVFVCHPVRAESSEEDIITRESWAADENIVSFEENYSFPTKVIIIPIAKKKLSSNSKEDIKELYYYFATRSGFGDLPFHYVVGWDGDIFEGNKAGEEAKIKFGQDEGALLIGYIQNSEEGLNVSSVTSIKDITLKVINKYSIEPENVHIKNLEVSFGEKGKIEETKLTEATKIWQEDFSLIQEALKNNYTPREITFSAELVSVDVPEDELQPGETTSVKIKIKNNGEFNFYSESVSNIFIVKDNPLDSRSSFYLPDIWDSPSRIGILDDGERLVIDEEKEFSFDIYIPLFPPEKKEEFVLVGPDGAEIPGSNFEITLKISQSDKTIIEVLDTPVGYLNVRETPGLGKVITKVIPGERFISLEYQDGYHKIDANGKVGWVVNTYIKVIN